METIRICKDRNVLAEFFSEREKEFAMNAPTMLVNSRRHQAFMSRRNTCPPNIRHQDLKMPPVDWDAPWKKPQVPCRPEPLRRHTAPPTQTPMMANITELKSAKLKFCAEVCQFHARPFAK